MSDWIKCLFFVEKKEDFFVTLGKEVISNTLKKYLNLILKNVKKINLARNSNLKIFKLPFFIYELIDSF